MRILTVGNMYPPHHYGGYELVWQSAVEHLRGRGHETRVLTTNTNTGAVASAEHDVYRELWWPLREARFVELKPRTRVALARHNHQTLARHLDDQRPHVIGWWSMGGLTLTMLETARRRGLPAVAFVHDDWLDYGRWADPWLHMVQGRRTVVSPAVERVLGIPARVDFGRAATYVFVSEHTRQHALRQGFPLPRTGVAHSGIHADFLDPAPQRDWAWRMLYVGRLDPRKGVQTAIDALADLPPQARLKLVGGGWDVQEEARLSQRARRLGVDSRVSFCGQLDRAEISAAYGQADVVLFPVEWEEPWGLVPLEAMARGRVVVATGRGGSGEYLRDSENCLLVPAGNPAALATAVTRLASQPELRESLRQAGLQTAPHYTEALFNQAVETALTEAAARRRHSDPLVEA